MNPTGDMQEQVFAFLSDPATHGGATVHRIDTHANSVFLAGDRAYKVKRAVRFPFLDYSTLEKRKAACLAEIEVNRAFAPQLYRRAVPVTRRADGSLALGGDGEAAEWAVEMFRFDEAKTLDRLAPAGSIDNALAQKLAAAVARSHEHSPVFDAARWLAAFEDYIGQNTEAFREQPALFLPAPVAALDEASRAALKRLMPLLRDRGRRGFVRRGHGDLHLGNIALLEGEPVPFDAIEFDPVIAAGDVLYDLAFLLMDLVERGLVPAANVVLNEYFARADALAAYDGLAALPLFMSMRAAIRAKVTAVRLSGEQDRAKIEEIRSAAATYFRLAVELIAPPPPRLIAVGGLSGTGKSALARRLAPHIAPSPGALVLRSDVERKRLFGIDETTRLPPEAYRPEVSVKVYDMLGRKAADILAAGHSAIVDAVFAKAAERDAMATIGKSAGVEFRGLFLITEIKIREQRVGVRVHDASDADAAVVRAQEGYELGTLTWPQIDTSGAPEQTLERALAHIA